VARAPLRISRGALEETLQELRHKLWDQLQRQGVFDDFALRKRANVVVRRFLKDQPLPPFTVRFSTRQNRRWGSCTVERDDGRIRVTSRLAGHPNWVLDHVLLHELIHLVHPHHGPQFYELLQRDPRTDRAAGYLEALETIEQLGISPVEAVAVSTLPVGQRVDLPLFPTL
jgi:predicted metal-dependent hydrolase